MRTYIAVTTLITILAASAAFAQDWAAAPKGIGEIAANGQIQATLAAQYQIDQKTLSPMEMSGILSAPVVLIAGRGGGSMHGGGGSFHGGSMHGGGSSFHGGSMHGGFGSMHQGFGSPHGDFHSFHGDFDRGSHRDFDSHHGHNEFHHGHNDFDFFLGLGFGYPYWYYYPYGPSCYYPYGYYYGAPVYCYPYSNFSQ
jgi:hypothetical protein